MKYVLVHGLSLNVNIWNQLTPLINDNVISVGLPGHCESEDTSYGWKDIWCSITERVNKNDWSDAVLVLHSFSAAVLPEVIASGMKPKKVILLEGILHSEDSTWTTNISNMSEYEYKIWFPRFVAVSAMALKSQLVQRYSTRDLNFWSDGIRNVNSTALRVMSRMLVDRLNHGTVESALRGTELNVFFIKGEKSVLTGAVDNLLKRCGVPLIKIPNASHFPMIDNPSVLLKYII